VLRIRVASVLLVTALCGLLAESSSGEILEVHPGEEIAPAIAEADSGDTVLVFPGVYSGEGNRGITLGGTDIVLASEAGPSQTIIDCERADRWLYLPSTSTGAILISGFTIANGYAQSGGGICAVGGTTTIVNCVFLNCDAGAGVGGGINLGSSARIEACTFAWCRAYCQPAGMNDVGGTGVCVSCWYGSPVPIERCLFIDGGVCGAVFCPTHDSAVVTHCVFDNNWSGAGWIEGENLEYVDANVCERGLDASYELCSDSVCLPEHNPWGVRVGATDVGCGPCNSVVETTSWGTIKALYRE